MKIWSGKYHLLHHPILKWVNACIGSFMQISGFYFNFSLPAVLSLPAASQGRIYIWAWPCYKGFFPLSISGKCFAPFFHPWCAPWLWINQCSVVVSASLTAFESLLVLIQCHHPDCIKWSSINERWVSLSGCRMPDLSCSRLVLLKLHSTWYLCRNLS